MGELLKEHTVTNIMTHEIFFEEIQTPANNKLGKIILNRPRVLNATDQFLLAEIAEQLEKWHHNPEIKAVLVRSGNEKAFCAGGDLRAIYEHRNCSPDEMQKFFRLEYNLDKYIAQYPKPYITFLNGITMGAGVGLSIHGKYSIAADNLRWAMPEMAIGYFPDVGASYYLSRLPHHIGTYLSLTGNSITAEEVLHLNFVDAIVPFSEFDEIEKKLLTAIDSNLGKLGDFFKSVSHIHKTTFSNQSDIEKCFQYDSVEKIIARVEKLKTPWALQVLEKMHYASPASLKVAFEALRHAKNKTVEEVIEMDYGICCEMLKNPDFLEGIRALIIDKDKKPKWNPAMLSDVRDEQVKKYFE